MLCILAACTVCSLQKGEKNQMLNVSYTTAMKGLACIVVVLVHIPAQHSNPVQDMIGSFGFVGVTAFFAISAYGFRVSMQRDEKYLARFWRKRIPALLIPALIINVVRFCVETAFFGNIDISGLWSFNSYIYAILVAYFVFWGVYSFLRKFPHKDFLISAIIVFLSLLTYFTDFRPFFIWPTESIGCVWGLMLFHWKDKFWDFINCRKFVSVLVLGLLSAAIGLSYLKLKTVFFLGAYLLKSILGAAILAFAMALLVGKGFRGNSVLVKLGEISYEVYLGHLIVLDYAQRLLRSASSGNYIWIVILVTLVFAFVIHSISSAITKKLRIMLK